MISKNRKAWIRDNLREIGEIDIDKLTAKTADEQFIRKLRIGFKMFEHSHPNFREQRLAMVGSFIKRVNAA